MRKVKADSSGLGQIKIMPAPEVGVGNISIVILSHLCKFWPHFWEEEYSQVSGQEYRIEDTSSTAYNHRIIES